MKKKQYKFRVQFKNRDAQAFGEVMEQLGKDKNGVVKPTEIVEAARAPTSPIHGFFDWDNDTAAEKYRLVQARGYVNNLEVEVKFKKGSGKQKAYFSVREGKGKKPKKAYVTVERALTENQLRTQIIKSAMNEVLYWERKYQEYIEFADIFNAIGKTKKRLKIEE